MDSGRTWSVGFLIQAHGVSEAGTRAEGFDILRLVRAVLAYLGLSGSSSRDHWKLALIFVLPPMIVATVISRAVGIQGVVGWGVGLVCLVALEMAWWLALAHSPIWRRALDRLTDQASRRSDGR
jgi:hypothetical protein